MNVRGPRETPLLSEVIEELYQFHRSQRSFVNVTGHRKALLMSKDTEEFHKCHRSQRSSINVRDIKIVVNDTGQRGTL